MKILFLTDDREDYLADSLLHGLISLGCHDVVDYPRKELLYSSTFPADRRLSVYGNGFTLYGLLPERVADRSLIWKRIENGEFDTIFIGNIWRQFGCLPQLSKSIKRCHKRLELAILDGDDDPRLYLFSAARLKEYNTCSSHLFDLGDTRVSYFKRELDSKQPHSWIENIIPRYLRQPALRNWLGKQLKVISCSFSIPSQWIREPLTTRKIKLLPKHIVDPEVINHFQTGSATYAFQNQTDYFEDLSSARYGITTKRSGWDCLRHYEIAAAGCVPCFRKLNRKHETSAPHGLDQTNCIIYDNAIDLQRKFNDICEKKYRELLQGSHRWILTHTTTEEAGRIISQLTHPTAVMVYRNFKSREKR